MPGKKYFEEDIRKWVSCYSEILCIGEVSRKFGVHKSIISKYFKKYKNKLNIKYKEEIQDELFKKDKRLCLPLTGCGKIKPLGDFYFRNDSGKHKEQCRECRLKYDKKWDGENKEHIKEYNKK